MIYGLVRGEGILSKNCLAFLIGSLRIEGEAMQEVRLEAKTDKSRDKLTK